MNTKEGFAEVGLFDSIKEKAQSAAHSVSKAVTPTVKKTPALVGDIVEKAPAAISHGARQAVDGVTKLATDPVGTVKEAAHQAADGARGIGRKITSAAKATVDVVKEAPKAIAHGVKQAAKGAAELGQDFVKDPGGTLKKVGHQAVAGAKAVGSWAWKNKTDVGFWVGTTALMLAVPVSGGASGALAGGMMAARGAAIATKLAQAGRIGAAAVKTARTGAGAISVARGALGGTKAAMAVAKGGKLIHAGRVALGATRGGRAMMAAAKPVNIAFNGIIGVNLADTSVKYARGEASGKDLALAALAATPLAISGVRGVAEHRVAGANAKAARVATKGLDRVERTAAGASDDAAQVATIAPRVNAPQTAGVASATRQEAVGTATKAQQVRTEAAGAIRRSTQPGSNMNATHLRNELEDVAARARTARAHATDAEHLAPIELTSGARQARTQLDAAAAAAEQTRSRVATLARRQQAADRVVDTTNAAKTTAGNVGSVVYTANNATAAAQERHEGFSMTDGSLAKSIFGILLGRTRHAANAR